MVMDKLQCDEKEASSVILESIPVESIDTLIEFGLNNANDDYYDDDFDDDYDDEGISDDTRSVDEFDDDDFDSFDDYNIKKEKRKKGDTFEIGFY